MTCKKSILLVKSLKTLFILFDFSHALLVRRHSLGRPQTMHRIIFFHLALFFSFFTLCPSHHCLTSYCQSLRSILGDAEYSHFHFNHSLWGLEGNLEVTSLSSHRSSVLSSCNRQRLVFLWTLEVEGAALFCNAAHSITQAHLTSGIFLILNCHLSPGDIQPLLRLSVMLCRINLPLVRHVISSFVLLLFYLCL